jgi:hypothetical protein
VRCRGTKCPLLRVFFFFSPFFLFSSEVVTFLPEWVIVGFQNFAWGLKSQKKIRFGVIKNGGTPLPPGGIFFRVVSPENRKVLRIGKCFKFFKHPYQTCTENFR